jgi:hypothetical protein
VAISAAIHPPKPSPTSDTPVRFFSAIKAWYTMAMSRTLRIHAGRSDLS